MTSPDRLYTVEEYLALDADAELRSEYVNGHVYTMLGAEPAHELICASVVAALQAGTRGRSCFVFGSNMRLKVEVSGSYTYPGISGLCGRAAFEPTRPQTLLNPSLIIEVLSPSTEAYDRGAKFAQYQLIPSLAEYVLVSQDHKRIERFVRDGSTWWLQHFTRPDDVVEIPSLGCAIRVGDVYERVDFLDGPPMAPRLLREPEAPAWPATV